MGWAYHVVVDCLGEGKIILMNKDFDPVLEVPIWSEVFSEGQFSVILL